MSVFSRFLQVTALAMTVIAVPVPAQASFSASAQPCDLFEANPRQMLAACHGEINGRSLTVSLFGNSTDEVHRVDFTWDDENTAFQSLELQVAPLIDPETVAIILADVDFDGFEDFAVMRALPQAGEAFYDFFLYDRQTERFVANHALSELPNVEIQPKARQLRSYWQRGAKTRGIDWYEWQTGKLILIRRHEEKYHNGNAGCRAQLFERNGTKLDFIRHEKCHL